MSKELEERKFISSYILKTAINEYETRVRATQVVRYFYSVQVVTAFLIILLSNHFALTLPQISYTCFE